MRSPLFVLGLCWVMACSGGDGDGNSDPGGTSSGGSSQTEGGGSNQPRAGSSSMAGSSSTGGGSSTAGAGGNGTGAGNDMYAEARVRCVNRVNELRASKGKGPIPRLASAEACADGQAKSDSETGKAHGSFDACLNQVKGWSGVAQNECPNYKSVEATLTGCIDSMWAEGPGGGHYDNMMSDSTYMACGFYTTPEGKVWQVQDYWTN